MFKLVISDDEGKSTSVPLVRDEITIGRKEGNTIRLTDRNVSRRHARLQKQNGHYLLHDLGSYNGIVINGARLNEARPLRHGDQIVIGDYKLAILEEGVGHGATPPANGASEASAASATAEVTTVRAHPSASPPPIPSAPPIPSQSPPPIPSARPPASPPPPPPPPVAALRRDLPDTLRQLRLVFLTPPGVPAPVTLDRLPLILGRSEAADVALPFPSISREHARLISDDDELIIEDMGSSNGILVNGEKVARSRLAPGDLVTLGVVEFRLARRGDDTVVVERVNAIVPPPRRSPTAAIMGILGGGAVLGLAAFLLLRPAHTDSPSIEPPRPGAAFIPQPAAAAASPTTTPEGAPAGTPPTENPPPSAPAEPTQQIAIAPPSVPEPPPGAALAPEAAVAPEAAAAPEPEPTTQEPTARPAIQPGTNRAIASRGALRPAGRARTATRHEERSASDGPYPAVSPSPPTTPVAAPSTNAGSTTQPPASASALDEARACLRHGDNDCAVQALRGHATTEPEIGLLAITYRQMGNRAEAERVMRRYLQRFGDNGARSASFRTYLGGE